ncbi:glycine receptor subunit alpha-2-like isoform X2 [Mercenaria mercenaria]|uniref:glycine receptor subunit alpha-2-like isoform X2 n=1 Tax=Mercenaria mercenaria TaxID=6596 RepID=UPI00234EC9E6|nr:glycine receptor subunit alpha-2-like isoform X2 [Mercenaria mercenaria]
MVKEMLCFLTLFSLEILQPINAQNLTEEMNMSTLLYKLFDGYDKKLSPKYKRGSNDQVVEVTANIFIISMFSISEIDMIKKSNKDDVESISVNSFIGVSNPKHHSRRNGKHNTKQNGCKIINRDYSLSMFLRERWKDERLVYDDVLNLTRLELDASLFDSIWVPDFFIITEKFSDFHEVTVPNKMVHIYPDGTVQYSARVTGSFFCVMDLRRYPFDTQHCKMEFESYGQTTKHLKFKWSDVPLTMGKDIKFPQFDLISTQTYNCDKDYFGIAFPCIGLKFILERNYAYHIIQIYVPSILIVILSWVNFWLDCTSVPGRVSLALLTVLTMTTQSAGARSNLPRVSYIKAIDVWMAACLTFVFLGLLEFAYVNVQSRVLNRRKSVIQFMVHQSSRSSSLPNGQGSNGDIGGYNESNSDSDVTKCSPCFKHLKGLERARAIDKISRVVFPVTFIIFNIIYWIYYFSWIPEADSDL